MGFVYTITNVINGKLYIGSTINVEQRWNTHKNSLLRNAHHCIYLQRSVLKYGIDNFVFNVVYQGPDYLNVEDEMIKNSSSRGFLIYNTAMYSTQLGVVKDVDQIKSDRMKQAYLDNPNLRTICSHSGESNGNWKGGISVSLCGCGNTKSVYALTCFDCRDVTGRNNPFFGKVHTDKTKNKLREANLGKLPINTKKIEIDGVEYVSQAEAARILGVAGGTITYRLKSEKYPSYKRISS